MKIKTLNAKRFWLTVVSILTVAFILPLFSYAGTPKERMPSTIGLSTFGQGTKPYIVVTAIAHAIEVKTGIKVRVIPAVTDKARLMTIIRGEALAGYFGMGSYISAGGIMEMLAEGPQRFNLVWAGAPAVVTIVVRGDSGIRTWEDIKGKRVADCRKINPAAGMVSEGNLAFGGVTFDDVISVPLAPYSRSTRALLDGAIDVSFDGTATPTIAELAASPHGIYIFQCPPDNVEGWKRFNKSCPPYRPYAFTWGHGANKENPKWWPANTIRLLCRPDADEELVYTTGKAMDKGYNLFKDAHGECPHWNIKSALNLDLLRGIFVPYHPGMVRYFKERKKWTDDHEKWQQSRIEFQHRVKQAYEKTIDEAINKGIGLGKKKFENLWRPKWDRLSSELAMKEF